MTTYRSESHVSWPPLFVSIIACISIILFAIPAKAQSQTPVGFPVFTAKFAKDMLEVPGLPSDHLAIYWHKDRQFQTLNLKTGEKSKPLQVEHKGGSCSARALSADGSKYVLYYYHRGRTPSEILVFSTKDGELLKTIQTDDRYFWMKFIDDKKIAVATPNEISVYDTVTGNRTLNGMKISRSHTLRPNYVRISNDGKQVACLGSRSRAEVWDLQTGDLKATLNAKSEVHAIEFSNDGKELMMVGPRTRPRFLAFSIATGKLTKEVELPKRDFPGNLETYWQAAGRLIEERPQGILVCGRIIYDIDAEKKVVWKTEADIFSPPLLNKIVDDSHQVVLKLYSEGGVFTQESLPWLEAKDGTKREQQATVEFEAGKISMKPDSSEQAP